MSRQYIFVTAHPSGLMLSADGEIIINQTVQDYCERTRYTIVSAGFERDYWHIILMRPITVTIGVEDTASAQLDSMRRFIKPMGVFEGVPIGYGEACDGPR